MQKSKRIGILVVGIIIVVTAIVFILPRNDNTKTENTQIAFYYIQNGNEIQTSNIPEGYILDTYTCNNNNITMSWNMETNKLKVSAKGAGSCKVYLESGTPQTYYWNAGFSGQPFYDYLPLETFSSVADLITYFQPFPNHPYYIKTTKAGKLYEHNVCTYINNTEFCMNSSYFSKNINDLDNDLTNLNISHYDCYDTSCIISDGPFISIQSYGLLIGYAGQDSCVILNDGGAYCMAATL